MLHKHSGLPNFQPYVAKATATSTSCPQFRSHLHNTTISTTTVSINSYTEANSLSTMARSSNHEPKSQGRGGMSPPRSAQSRKAIQAGTAAACGIPSTITVSSQTTAQITMDVYLQRPHSQTQSCPTERCATLRAPAAGSRCKSPNTFLQATIPAVPPPYRVFRGKLAHWAQNRSVFSFVSRVPSSSVLRLLVT